MRQLPPPEEEWLCDSCAVGLPTQRLRCALCPVLGGAFKPSDRGIEAAEPLAAVLAALDAGTPPPFRAGKSGRVRHAHSGGAGGAAAGGAAAGPQSARRVRAKAASLAAAESPAGAAPPAEEAADAVMHDGAATEARASEVADGEAAAAAAPDTRAPAAVAGAVPVEWAHVTCGVWVPEVHFVNVETMSPVAGLEVRIRGPRGVWCTH